MVATITTKTARDAQAIPQTFAAAMLDMLGDGSKLAFLHALLNSAGTLIDPASSADVATATAKMEAVRALLAATLTVQGAVTANVGTTNGLGLDASLQSILTKDEAIRTLIASIDGKAATLGPKAMAGSSPVVIASDQPAVPTLAFTALRGGTQGLTTALTVGPVATTAPVALPACIATSYRVRNPAASASPVTWILTTDNTKTPALPVPAGTNGVGATPGDKTIDPGGVEIFGLSAAQQAALAAGTLYLTALTPAGGSAALYITPGNGA